MKIVLARTDELDGRGAYYHEASITKAILGEPRPIKRFF